MRIIKRVGLLLIVLVYVLVIAEDLTEKPPHELLESILKQQRPDLHNRVEKLFRHYEVLYKSENKHQEEIEQYKQEVIHAYKKLNENLQKMPHLYFMCAMQFMKIQGSNIFYDVAGVGHLQLPGELRPWTPRIQKIRVNFDKHDEEKPCKMYPSKQLQPKKKQDTENYNRWLEFVTCEHYRLSFQRSNKPSTEFQTLGENWRAIAKYLQGNLTMYFDKLDANVRLDRYSNNKTIFLENFAAIIQRGFRVSCYFERSLELRLQAELNAKYDNGTKLFLEDALFRADRNWYFPQEHIDMYNILINSTASDPENIHNMFPCVNVIALGEPFVIPGIDACGRTAAITTPSLLYLKSSSSTVS